MIIQAYQTLSEFNRTGADGILLYVSTIWSGFIPTLLFVFFIMILLSTIFSQKRFGGNPDIVSAFAVSSFVTMVIAISLTLIDGLINLPTLSTIFVITIVSVLWLLLSKEKNF